MLESRPTFCAFIAVLILCLILPGRFALLDPAGQLSNQAFGVSIVGLTFSNPELYGVSGDKIDSVEVGQQSIIKVKMHNYPSIETDFAIIVEVRDGDGVTRYLSWQTTTVEANSDYSMETSWMPMTGCMFPYESACENFEIRTFAITGFDNPRVLSPAYSTDGIKVVESPYHTGPASGHHPVITNGKSYNIEYSIDSGRIQSIQVDSSVASIIITLKGVRGDNSSLVLRFPNEMLKELEAASNFYYCLGNEFVVFVNEIPADDITQANTGRGEIMTISIDSGSETIEILGTNLLIEPPTCD